MTLTSTFKRISLTSTPAPRRKSARNDASRTLQHGSNREAQSLTPNVSSLSTFKAPVRVLLPFIIGFLILFASGISHAAEPAHRVTLHWHTGPTLVASININAVDSWLFVQPLTAPKLADFLERSAKGKLLAWNITSQVKQVAAQLRALNPDPLPEPWPKGLQSDGLNIDGNTLVASLVFRAGKERWPVLLTVERLAVSELEAGP